MARCSNRTVDRTLARGPIWLSVGSAAAICARSSGVQNPGKPVARPTARAAQLAQRRVVSPTMTTFQGLSQIAVIEMHRRSFRNAAKGGKWEVGSWRSWTTTGCLQGVARRPRQECPVWWHDMGLGGELSETRDRPVDWPHQPELTCGLIRASMSPLCHALTPILLHLISIN